jgi:integrase
VTTHVEETVTMSESHSTPAPVRSKAAEQAAADRASLTPTGGTPGVTPAVKPEKPRPDFPLFPHATKRWAKKIAGRMHYFGTWDDPAGALREYEAFAAGKPLENASPRADGKPEKPYPEFPLFAHAARQWAKKIRGRTHYFGPWEDPDGALAKYNEQKDDLHAGKTPKQKTDGITVKQLCNRFLDAKQALVDSHELSPRTLTGYREMCAEVIPAFGWSRLVSDLDPADFAKLRNKMTKKWGPHRLGTTIQCVRCLFKFAYDAGLITAPVRFGPGFKRPSKKTLRLHRAAQGPKLFTAAEIRDLLDRAGPAMRAMILLGINCGFGNNDCGTIPLSAVNLETGWIDFPRPKTGIARRCALWPETTEAIRQAIAKRPEPKNTEDAGLVFITKYGESWSKDIADSPITKEMRKLLDAAGYNGHRCFYALRHSFRTVADAAKDQPAADFIMGHEAPHMSSHYREAIDDARLQAIADHVRTWLFAEIADPTKGQ